MRRKLKFKHLIIFILLIVFVTIGMYSFSFGAHTFYKASGFITMPEPSMSPDGKKLAFASVFMPGSYKVTVLDLNTKKTISLPNENMGISFAWASDSKSIIFPSRIINNALTFQLSKQNIYDNRVAILTKSFDNILSSPKSFGNSILFLESTNKYTVINIKKYYYNNLWYYDNGKYITVDTGLIYPEKYCFTHNKILYLKNVKSNNRNTWNLLRKDMASNDINEIEENVTDYFLDGDYIYALKKEENRVGLEKISLFDLSKKKLTVVSNFQYPTFSFDCRKLAYIRNNQIWVLDLDTLTEKKLTNTFSFRKKFPLLTKDCQHLIYFGLKDIVKIKIN